MSLAGTWAVSDLVRPPESTEAVVVRFDPFHRTTEPWLKVLPFTVSVKTAPPVVALAGDNDWMTGAGDWTGKLYGVEVAPPELMTWAVQLAGSLPKVALTCSCELLM